MAAATAGIRRRRLRLGLTADQRGAAPAADSGPDADRAVRESYRTQYCSLVRLAVLLVGDVAVAEGVVQDSFVAVHAARRLRDPDTALSYLRRDVLRRSRAARRHRAPASGVEAPATAAQTPVSTEDAGQAAVLAAMQLLPPGQREALVLLLYLDLPEEQAAATMGISRRAVQDHAARGRAALQSVL